VVITPPVASVSRLPSDLTHCPATPQQSISCGCDKSQILPYRWDFISALSDITAKGMMAGRVTDRKGWQGARPDAPHGSPRGRAARDTAGIAKSPMFSY
jgi:hypothetical protein